MLVVFGGLPATGKSTIAGGLAQAIHAVHLRIDTIEQTIRDADLVKEDVGSAGYLIGYQVARDNLRIGQTVVADSVNPIAITRDAWRRVGEDAGISVLEIEVICSDVTEHRRRVEKRKSNIEGLMLPTWDTMTAREYEPWKRDRNVIDTAGQSVEESIAYAIRLSSSFT